MKIVIPLYVCLLLVGCVDETQPKNPTDRKAELTETKTLKVFMEQAVKEEAAKKAAAAVEAEQEAKKQRVDVVRSEWGKINRYQTRLNQYRILGLDLEESLKATALELTGAVNFVLVGIASPPTRGNKFFMVKAEITGSYTVFEPDRIKTGVAENVLLQYVDRKALQELKTNVGFPTVMAICTPAAAKASDFENKFQGIFKQLANHVSVRTSNFDLMMPSKVPLFVFERNGTFTHQDFFVANIENRDWTFDTTAVKGQVMLDHNLVFTSPKYSMPVKPLLAGTISDMVKDEHGYTAKVTSPVGGTSYEVIVSYKNLLAGDRNLNLGSPVRADDIIAIADKLTITVELARNSVVEIVDLCDFSTKIEPVRNVLDAIVDGIGTKFSYSLHHDNVMPE